MTGFRGGVFKELVLNNILLEKFSGAENLAILELGAGNGYFSSIVASPFFRTGSFKNYSN